MIKTLGEINTLSGSLFMTYQLPKRKVYHHFAWWLGRFGVLFQHSFHTQGRLHQAWTQLTTLRILQLCRNLMPLPIWQHHHILGNSRTFLSFRNKTVFSNFVAWSEAEYLTLTYQLPCYVGTRLFAPCAKKWHHNSRALWFGVLADGSICMHKKQFIRRIHSLTIRPSLFPRMLLLCKTLTLLPLLHTRENSHDLCHVKHTYS